MTISVGLNIELADEFFSRFYRKAYSSFSLYSICFGNTPTPLFLYGRHASRKLKSAARVRSARPREDRKERSRCRVALAIRPFEEMNRQLPHRPEFNSPIPQFGQVGLSSRPKV